ncbi:hypothetical protein WJX82_009549 [Trebouxia sp. C0006]
MACRHKTEATRTGVPAATRRSGATGRASSAGVEVVEVESEFACVVAAAWAMRMQRKVPQMVQQPTLRQVPPQQHLKICKHRNSRVGCTQL